MRALACVVLTSVLLGCSIAPQLAPAAAGCYSVHLDSVPAQFHAMQVPPVPAVVRLDTAYGGQVQVPRAWFDAAGYRQRGAGLGLARPGWRIVDGVLANDRARPTPLPPDTLILHFSGPVSTLSMLMGAEPSGDWRGLAFTLTGATPYGQPMVPARLQRTACGPTPMALSR